MYSLLKQTTLYLILATLALTCFSTIALADPTTPTTPPVVDSFSVGDYLDLSDKGAAKFGTDDKEISSIAEYLIRGINYGSLLIGSFAFLSIVIGGILLVTSGGLESQVQRGKDIIKFAIIGLIMALLAFFIVSFIQSVVYEYGT